MLNTIVIDNQNLFKEGFKLLLVTIDSYRFHFLDFTLNELINNNINEKIDLIFLDLNQTHLNEMEQFEEIRNKYQGAKIVILSVFKNTKVVREAFQQGIDGYILKDSHVSDVESGLAEILEGRTYMTEGLRLTPKKGHKPKSEVRQNLFNNDNQVKQKLTKRENEVLELIVMAKSNKEIGDDLFISEQTVGVHKKNIMRKLGVHNTVSLIRFAIDHNLA